MPSTTARSPREEDHFLLVSFLWLCTVAALVLLWMISRALRMTLGQMLELVSYCALATFCIGTAIAQVLQRPAKLARQWPRPRLVMPEKRDQEYLRAAADSGSALLGYEHDGTPVYWADTDRAMQSNLPGLSGMGKTTLLLSIVQQDIRRGHPVIYFDGKGDKELVLRLIHYADEAGRGHQVKVIDPTHPGISDHFNPFYSRDGRLQERVGAVFESLGASRTKDEFWSEHQRAFLNAVTVILEHAGEYFTFGDLLVACQSPETMNGFIRDLGPKVIANETVPEHRKRAFLLAAATLEGNYQDEDWLLKIRGLLNSMMPFVGESLSLITGPCDHPVTFEEVVEEKQILIVTMNLGTDSQPARALGRILMRNLQFMISSRYNEYRHNQKHSFISVVLDEFGLYAYHGFSSIIHTARQANAGFIFSFQSIKQLATLVGESFADDVANAPNTKFLMQISEKDTAESFLSASARVPTERLSMRVEKLPLQGRNYVEEGTGTRQEVMETRVKDYQIKVLPRGQMMALLPDERMGVIVKHIHVRPPYDYFLPLDPTWLPPLLPPRGRTLGLNLSPRMAYSQPESPKSGQRRSRL